MRLSSLYYLVGRGMICQEEYDEAEKVLGDQEFPDFTAMAKAYIEDGGIIGNVAHVAVLLSNGKTPFDLDLVAMRLSWVNLYTREILDCEYEIERTEETLAFSGTTTSLLGFAVACRDFVYEAVKARKDLEAYFLEEACKVVAESVRTQGSIREGAI
jgi:hypothetical protein